MNIRDVLNTNEKLTLEVALDVYIARMNKLMPDSYAQSRLMELASIKEKLGVDINMNAK